MGPKWRRRILIGVLITAVFVVITPFVAVEVIYRVQMSRVLGRPHADHLLRPDQESEIADCFHFEEMRPVWPWSLLSPLLGAHAHAGPSQLAQLTARKFLDETSQAPRGNFDWALRVTAVEIWVSRNMTRSEAVASLGEKPYPDIRIDLLLRDRVCDPKGWRKMDREKLREIESKTPPPI